MEKLKFSLEGGVDLPSIIVTAKDGRKWRLRGTLAVFDVADTGKTVPGRDFPAFAIRSQVLFDTEAVE